MGKAFNHWYHVTAWTYGQWVRGDLRGWRARRHREHCEGDYRNRPDPDEHARERKFSYDAMKRDPVKLASHLRQIVLDAVMQNLLDNKIQVLCAELDGVHLHVLARFTLDNVRRQMGWSKLHATKTLKAHCTAVGYDLGLQKGEGIWAKRCGVKPIADRNHQLDTVAYILDHEQQGATTWITPDWRDRAPELRKWIRDRRRKR